MAVTAAASALRGLLLLQHASAWCALLGEWLLHRQRRLFSAPASSLLAGRAAAAADTADSNTALTPGLKRAVAVIAAVTLAVAATAIVTATAERRHHPTAPLPETPAASNGKILDMHSVNL